MVAAKSQWRNCIAIFQFDGEVIRLYATAKEKGVSYIYIFFASIIILLPTQFKFLVLSSLLGVESLIYL
mgnify:CR=1 FL=1